MAIETVVAETNDSPPEGSRTAQVDIAIVAMLRELLVEQREVIARLLRQQQSGGVTPTDPGPATELIDQYRRIQRALALTD
jgi:hypothetical protein